MGKALASGRHAHRREVLALLFCLSLVTVRSRNGTIGQFLAFWSSGKRSAGRGWSATFFESRAGGCFRALVGASKKKILAQAVLISPIMRSGSKRCRLPVSLIACSVLCFLVHVGHASAQISHLARTPGAPEEQEIIRTTSLPRRPGFFELNKGQFDGNARFVGIGERQAVKLIPAGFVLAVGDVSETSNGKQDRTFPRELVMRFLGANHEGAVRGVDPWAGTVSYFSGADSSRWISGVPRFSQVRYDDLYPGVDLIVYWKGKNLEYDLLVQPGADPSAIRFGFEGLTNVSLSDEGDLILTGHGINLRQRRPLVYQTDGGDRLSVAGAFQLRGGNEVGFKVGDYDRKKTLLIDPVLIYSTYLGGSGFDQAHAVGVDPRGNVFVGGTLLYSRGFPFVQQDTITTEGGFVVQIDPTREGQDSFLGGVVLDGVSQLSSLHVTAGGEVYITGVAGIPFPVTETALDRFCGLDTSDDSCSLKDGDIFMSVLRFPTDAEPRLEYSTFIGGGNDETGPLMHVDDDGTLYLAAVTGSPEIPMVGSYDASCGTNGLCNAFETDSPSNRRGNFYSDVLLLKIDPRLRGRQGLLYSTYIGGGRREYLSSMVVDETGAVLLAGETLSFDFPTTAGPFVGYPSTLQHPPPGQGNIDAFLVKLDTTVAGPAGLLYGSFIGGSDEESVADLAVDEAGGVYIGGSTGSSDFPLRFAADSTRDQTEGFLAFFDPTRTGDESLAYATYLGGSGKDNVTHLLASDHKTVFVVGNTHLGDFPVAPGFQGEVEIANLFLFLLRLDPGKRGIESYLSSMFLNLAWVSSLSQAEDGSLLLSGVTTSDHFPTPPAELPNSREPDVFYARLRPSSTAPLEYEVSGGRFGGRGEENLPSEGSVVWLADTVLLVGDTIFGNFPTTASAFQSSDRNESRETGFLSIVAEQSGGSLAVYPPTIDFASIWGEPAPSGQRVLVAPTDEPVGFSVSVEGGGWLSADLSGGTAPEVINVRANTSGLRPGQYRGRITVAATSGPRVVKSVPVRFVLGEGLPAPNTTGLVNAATFRYGAISPGEIVSLSGVRMGPRYDVPLQLDGAGRVGAELAGVRVLFDDDPAPLVFAQANQLIAIVPYSVAGKVSVEMVTEYLGVRSAPTSLEVTDVSPGIFTLSRSNMKILKLLGAPDAFTDIITLHAPGSGSAAVLNEDLSVNSPANPAQRGSVIVLFATGEGDTVPPGRDGVLAGEVLPRPKLPVMVRVAGIACEVLYAGALPGVVAGVMQVKARLNYAVPPGDELSIELYVGDKVSRRDVTVAVEWPPLR